MTGRYPFKPAWGRRRGLLTHTNDLTTSPWNNWFLGPDTIVASTLYTKGFGTLKRWDTNMGQWLPAVVKVHYF